MSLMGRTTDHTLLLCQLYRLQPKTQIRKWHLLMNRLVAEKTKEKTTNVRMKIGQINEIDSQIQNRTVRPHRKMHQSTKPQLNSTEPSAVTHPPKFPSPPTFSSTKHNKTKKTHLRSRRGEWNGMKCDISLEFSS